MSLYVDASAFLKLYIDEIGSSEAEALIVIDADPATSRITIVEVRRNLTRLLSQADAASAVAAFEEHLGSFSMVELDAATCDRAASLAEVTGVRSLDALHLAAAVRIGATAFLTFDARQAQAARTLGLPVLGV